MIPVFEPEITEEDVQAVSCAVRAGEVSGSFGVSIPEFERQFADYCGSRHGIAVSNGTTALHLAVDVAGIGPGDDVLVSSSTNIASALAIHHNGANTIAVDSEDETWNLDLDLIESKITSRTKAIIAVHLLGHPVDMDRLMEIADRHQLLVIEDAAEAHGATVRGRKVGSFGHMACFSFYANKLITTGEGGMITTNNDQYAERLRSLRNLAFTQPRFWHKDAGYNFRMTGMQAALGISQLQRLEHFIEQKRRLARTYNQFLAAIPGLDLPVEASWAKNVYWMYGMVVRPEFGISRDELTNYLRQQGVDTRTFFCPMNLQPCLRLHPDSSLSECPIAEELWHSGLYLPSSTSLDLKSIHTISELIKNARGQRRMAA